jgi:phage terminase large subunit
MAQEAIQSVSEQDTVNIPLPPKMVELFQPEYGALRYRAAKGGRGSGKTRGFALMTAVIGYQLGMNGASGQIVCCRQYQNSLADSSLMEIKEAISDHDWLAEYWEVGETFIRSRDRRITFTFLGLQRNLQSLKSTARILLCWVDEAEYVSESSWSVLAPTVRQDGSEIWLSYNPETRHSATDERFVQNPPDNLKMVTMNYMDNPWFPAVLEEERLNDLKLRPDTYSHIWEGEYLEYTEGAYYLREMRQAEQDNRITLVPHDAGSAVFTAWDLGIDDSTAIWFFQRVGMEVRLIDYIEDSGFALQHYVQLLDERAKPGPNGVGGYRYAGHVLPHDVEVRELGTGKSRKEILQSLGMRDITVCPKLDVEDGIQAVRDLLGRCYFDAEKCVQGIRAMRQYQRLYDDQRQVWKARPLHDWSSHAADAFRYLAVGMPSERMWNKSVKRNVRGIA